MIDKKKDVKSTKTINFSYFNMNNTTKNIKFSTNDSIGIARETMNFLTAYPRIRAIIVSPHDKIPSEHAWQNFRNYPVSSEKVYNYLLKGGNWGLTHPAGMSVGIDEDNEKIRNATLSLGDTTRFNTGTLGHFCDLFLIKDEPVGNIPLIDGAYIRGKGGQNIGPGSIHPNGNIYGSTYLHLVPPLEVTKSELLEAFMPYIIGKEKLFKNESTKTYRRVNNLSVKATSSKMIERAATEILDLWEKADHRRHDLTLALIGYLERQRWTEDDIQDLILILVKTTGKGAEHISQVHYAYGNDSKKYGLPTIIEIEGEINGHR